MEGYELVKEGKTKEAIPHLLYAAEKGDVYAMCRLGEAYNVLKNYRESFKWTYKAACSNNIIAIYNLCNMYRNGEYVPCSLKKFLNGQIN